MVRKGPSLNKRSSTMSWEEAIYLTALGGKPRPDWHERPGRVREPATISRVLCPGCREYHSPVEVEMCMVLPRKSLNGKPGTSSSSGPPLSGIFAPFSELWAFLTTSTYPDGAPRLTGRLSLKFSSGLLGISLDDAETGLYAFLEGTSLDDLLLSIETQLEAGTLPWRPSRYAKQGKK